MDIWSELHCPWALIAIHRLRAARQAHHLDVLFTPRAWPLEWVNDRGTPRAIVAVETGALASHEPELFHAYSAESWPSTFLPAFELVAAARRLYGATGAEDVAYATRIAFFRDGADVSIAAGLRRALELAAENNAAVDPNEVMQVWTHANVRSDVAADYEQSKRLPIQGSPQIFWPDGTTDHNPGMTNHEWHDGSLQIGTVDPHAPQRLILAAIERQHRLPRNPSSETASDGESLADE